MIEDISNVEFGKLREEQMKELAMEEQEYNSKIASQEKEKSNKNQAILEAFYEEVIEDKEQTDDMDSVVNFEKNITTNENGEEKVEVIVP